MKPILLVVIAGVLLLLYLCLKTDTGDLKPLAPPRRQAVRVAVADIDECGNTPPDQPKTQGDCSQPNGSYSFPTGSFCDDPQVSPKVSTPITGLVRWHGAQVGGRLFDTVSLCNSTPLDQVYLFTISITGFSGGQSVMNLRSLTFNGTVLDNYTVGAVQSNTTLKLTTLVTVPTGPPGNPITLDFQVTIDTPGGASFNVDNEDYLNQWVWQLVG